MGLKMWEALDTRRAVEKDVQGTWTHWQWQRARRHPTWGAGAEVDICEGQGFLSSFHEHGEAVYSLKDPFPCSLFHLVRNVGPCDPLKSMVKGVSGRGGGNSHCSEWLAWDTSPDGGPVLCFVAEEFVLRWLGDCWGGTASKGESRI